MKKQYSQKIAGEISRFLENDDWKYTFLEKEGVFRFGVNLRSKIREVHYALHVRNSDYIVYGLIPISADPDDPDMMLRMAEFLCRANYGLNNGNFELDFYDGEIRYKCYVDFDGIDTPSQDIIEHSIYYPAVMFKHYCDGIIDIIFNGMSAKKAIAICEAEAAENDV